MSWTLREPFLLQKLQLFKKRQPECRCFISPQFMPSQDLISKQHKRFKINTCLFVITEICHSMGRSSGSPILEELSMFTPNSGSSNSSIGKGILQLQESEGPVYISPSFDLYYVSAFYLLVHFNIFYLCDAKENKLIFFSCLLTFFKM